MKRHGPVNKGETLLMTEYSKVCTQRSFFLRIRSKWTFIIDKDRLCDIQDRGRLQS